MGPTDDAGSCCNEAELRHDCIAKERDFFTVLFVLLNLPTNAHRGDS